MLLFPLLHQLSYGGSQMSTAKCLCTIYCELAMMCELKTTDLCYFARRECNASRSAAGL
uniref:Uncharacterized protein n=1 Tax=Anguilla anguilla TaxID=7936 RepID=A0A0E9R763_ANGAN